MLPVVDWSDVQYAAASERRRGGFPDGESTSLALEFLMDTEVAMTGLLW